MYAKFHKDRRCVSSKLSDILYFHPWIVSNHIYCVLNSTLLKSITWFLWNRLLGSVCIDLHETWRVDCYYNLLDPFFWIFWFSTDFPNFSWKNCFFHYLACKHFLTHLILSDLLRVGFMYKKFSCRWYFPKAQNQSMQSLLRYKLSNVWFSYFLKIGPYFLSKIFSLSKTNFFIFKKCEYFNVYCMKYNKIGFKIKKIL